MKLTDLIPSSDAVAGFRGIEQGLQSRRYKSLWGLIVAVVSVVVQIALAYKFAWPPLPNFSSLKDVRHFLASPAVILPCVAIVAALIWVFARYTGFLFKQSKEPFRYTFCIKEFSAIASTPGERFPVARIDQLKLLRSDLTERLDNRVRRFSLLENPNTGGAAQSPKAVNPTSHFHIEGDYAVREENEGWILHVWPRVRIGPEGNAFTLAFPVRLPFDVNGEKSEEVPPGSTLDVEEYGRLVERVYSSVATEIYKQIEIDLRDKMTLFPTGSLRALARYNEAEDFETSNTIEAYDRALDMYQLSLDELKASRWHGWMKSVGHRWPWLVSWDWTGIRAAMEAEAKTELGYSRCLIYRRLVSEMAGRDRNPIFDAPRRLEEARKLLQQCYNSFRPKQDLMPAALKTDTGSRATLHDAALKIALAADAISETLGRKQLYQIVRDELCEAFSVAALAHSLLDDSKNAQNFLQLADALAINSGSNRVRVLLLLVKTELEPVLQQKMSYLNQARKLNPNSEIVLYRFAYYSDLLARDTDTITRSRVEYLSCEYEAVLKVNPANIASLIGQGCLFWLVDDLDKACMKLRAGLELQKVVTQTFVGDLKYCLARVEVELAHREFTKPDLSNDQFTRVVHRLNKAVFDYEEATAADPFVAASYRDTQGSSRNTYYERINQQMLDRYQLFVSRVREISDIAANQAKLNVKFDDHLVSTVYPLLSNALNDYGNACLNYYLRFDVWTSRDGSLRQALGRLEESTTLDRSNVMAEYNWFSALTWTDDVQAISNLATSLLQKSAALSPMALAAVVTRAAQRASDELNDLEAEIPKSETEQKLLAQELKKLELSVENQKEEERPKYEEDLAQKRQSLAKKENTLKQKGDRKRDLEKQLREYEQKPVLDVLPKTRLGPFAEYMSPARIGELLEKRDISWTAFGDKEVFALAALAQVWALRSEGRDASRRLCKHIRQSYYPENWDVIVNLASVTTVPEERAELDSVRDKAIDWSLIYDPESRFYKFLRLKRCDEVFRDSNEWPYRFSKDSPYEQAIEVFKNAESQCGDFPAFHYSLAFAYEYRAKQLAGNTGDRDRALEYRKLALRERWEACRLAPENQEYRDRLLPAAGGQLLAANTLEDPLEQRTVPRLIEVEFASDSVPDLGFTKAGLAAELQQRISDVRAHLKSDPGFILSGINFKDNVSFERGQFRFLIRGVPLPVERLSFEAPQSEQWDEMARRIQEVAFNNAARFYTSQDCSAKLSEISTPDGVDYSDIQNDSDSLFALSWVLKALLSERAPISDFASIVAEFRRCRSRNLGLVTTVEEIRSLPQIRKRLPGNSLDPAPAIRSLSQDLEDRMYSAIDWNCSEPILNAPPEIRQEVRSLALKAKIEAGKHCAVLLTSPAARPFARKMIEGIDVNVLSRREVLSALLSRIKDSDAAGRTQLHSKAGN